MMVVTSNLVWRGCDLTRDLSVITQDPYGNSYYELPAQPQLGKRRPSRWYNTADVSSSDAETGPSEKWGGFDAELPAEWESWLRHRSVLGQS